MAVYDAKTNLKLGDWVTRPGDGRLGQVTELLPFSVDGSTRDPARWELETLPNSITVTALTWGTATRTYEWVGGSYYAGEVVAPLNLEEMREHLFGRRVLFKIVGGDQPHLKPNKEEPVLDSNDQFVAESVEVVAMLNNKPMANYSKEELVKVLQHTEARVNELSSIVTKSVALTKTIKTLEVNLKRVAIALDQK